MKECQTEGERENKEKKRVVRSWNLKREWREKKENKKEKEGGGRREDSN